MAVLHGLFTGDVLSFDYSNLGDDLLKRGCLRKIYAIDIQALSSC